jgi:hypothetical protein
MRIQLHVFHFVINPLLAIITFRSGLKIET